MILGFLGLLTKLLKELAGVDPYSPEMVAFQAADLIVFILAIALILQSLFVFLRLRRKNIQAEKAELISSQDLYEAIQFQNEAKAPRRGCCNGRQTGATILSSDVNELTQLRLLRHFFLRTYGLPELFPFSKYLRQAQDNMISHMIEVEVSTWMMLLAIAWGLERVAFMIYAVVDTIEENFSIVLAFQGLTWTAVVLHFLTLLYLEWGIRHLRKKAVKHGEQQQSHHHHQTRLECLKEVADIERETVDHEKAMDAIVVMERVREREQRHRGKRTHCFLIRHDTGFQLIFMICKNVLSPLTCGLFRRKKVVHSNEDRDDKEDMEAAHKSIRLAGFSRKLWHFMVMSLLMINGFFIALFCQCIVYQFKTIYDDMGIAPLVMTPQPLLINAILLQPRIMRNFFLISSITRVDDKALGDVIDHFTETVQLRSEFVNLVFANLEQTNRSIANLMEEFRRVDNNQSGYVDVEDARLVLRKNGFALSFFRFNSVAKLLFTLKGARLEYAQVQSLLELSLQEPIHLFGETMVLYNGSERTAAAAPQLARSPYVDPLSPASASASMTFKNPLPTTQRRPMPLQSTSSSTARSLYQLHSQSSGDYLRDHDVVTMNYVQL